MFAVISLWRTQFLGTLMFNDINQECTTIGKIELIISALNGYSIGCVCQGPYSRKVLARA